MPRIAYLSNQMIGLSLNLVTAVGRQALLVKIELETEGLNAQGATLDTTLTELLGQVLGASILVSK